MHIITISIIITTIYRAGEIYQLQTKVKIISMMSIYSVYSHCNYKSSQLKFLFRTVDSSSWIYSGMAGTSVSHPNQLHLYPLT